jgi:hypothetical protein
MACPGQLLGAAVDSLLQLRSGLLRESERNDCARLHLKRFKIADLVKRDEFNLDITWLKHENLDDADSPPQRRLPPRLFPR